MPKRVVDLKKEKEIVSLRKQILQFLKESPDLAYTLKEIYEKFLNLDKREDKNYVGKEKVLYKLIYTYLREFKIKGVVTHKGKYYFYEKKDGKNKA